MENKWTFIKTSGKVMEKSEIVEKIQKVTSLFSPHFPDEKDILQGIILEDYSKGWIFTKDTFYSANISGDIIIIPYKEILKTSLHPSEAYKKPEYFDVFIKTNEQDVIDNLGNIKKVADATRYSVKNTGNMEELLRMLEKCFSHNRQ